MRAAIDITKSLRGRWYGGSTGYGMIKCPAHDDKDPSCRIRDGEKGVLVSCYAGCDRTAIIDALKRQGLWPERERTEPRPKQQRTYVARPACAARSWTRNLGGEERERIAFARAIWNASVEAPGTPVERYWHEARGITLAIPKVIRFGAAVPYGYRDGAACHKAMVALVQDPHGGFAGVHCTFLRSDGSGKRTDLPNDRLVYGSVGGCAIRLAEATDELAIGEGIESTASYMQDFQVPGWATMNTSGLRNVVLPPPPVAFAVTLLGENDEAKGPKHVAASPAAIEASSFRLRAEGRLVTAAFPAEEFGDFNDPYKQQMKELAR